ncbi:hypothetical protein D3C81_2131490 [compost metagenome]
MGIVIARDVSHADICRKDGKLATLAVIEQVDLHFVARVVNTLRGKDRIAHYIQRFVISGDIDVDRRPE